MYSCVTTLQPASLVHGNLFFFVSQAKTHKKYQNMAWLPNGQYQNLSRRVKDGTSCFLASKIPLGLPLFYYGRLLNSF